jgi:uncharacterized protein (DUF2384 family)
VARSTQRKRTGAIQKHFEEKEAIVSIARVLEEALDAFGNDDLHQDHHLEKSERASPQTPQMLPSNCVARLPGADAPFNLLKASSIGLRSGE